MTNAAELSTTRTSVGDTYRFSFVIRGSADDCGPDRCYFAVDSYSEGMAPLAVVVVPVLD